MLQKVKASQKSIFIFFKLPIKYLPFVNLHTYFIFSLFILNFWNNEFIIITTVYSDPFLFSIFEGVLSSSVTKLARISILYTYYIVHNF